MLIYFFRFVKGICLFLSILRDFFGIVTNFERLLLRARPASRARCAALRSFFGTRQKTNQKSAVRGQAPLHPRAAEPRIRSACLTASLMHASKALPCKASRRCGNVLPPTTRGQDFPQHLAALQREHPKLTSFMALYLFPQHLTRGVQLAERAILERAKAKVSQKLFACSQ